MKITLGYVAISKTLDISASKTMTYTNYLKKIEKSKPLNDIIKTNIYNLKEILKYNFKNDIHFYRLSYKIIPLATHPKVNLDYITPYKKEWEEIGYMTKIYNIRMDTHPDHFCVLNSKDKNVVNSSKKILEYQSNLFKAMKINGKTVLHIGGMYQDKENSIKRFINNFKTLDQNIKDMIILENDDKTYNIEDTLSICEKLNIPMVLDYHHYKCNTGNLDIKKYLPRIIKTWKEQKLNPKMHFSSPKDKKNFRAHSKYINPKDFIEFLKVLKPLNRDIDIMLECKAKDEALFRLTRQLKTQTNYKFINETTFII